MPDRTFHLEIRTPQKLIYAGEVVSLRAPGIQGAFEILASHIPFLTVLGVGEIRIRESDTPQLLATSGGVLEALRTGTTLLAETTEWAHEIDVERAEAARRRALETLASRDPNINREQAEEALARAMNRLRIARSR
jgi:F-type H+-transporting ATPase subunit epsilon